MLLPSTLLPHLTSWWSVNEYNRILLPIHLLKYSLIDETRTLLDFDFCSHFGSSNPSNRLKMDIALTKHFKKPSRTRRDQCWLLEEYRIEKKVGEAKGARCPRCHGSSDPVLWPLLFKVKAAVPPAPVLLSLWPPLHPPSTSILYFYTSSRFVALQYAGSRLTFIGAQSFLPLCGL